MGTLNSRPTYTLKTINFATVFFWQEHHMDSVMLPSLII